ncbi:hypothetical protein [Acrocarpospora sp. B8E8]|uniref:hypothetical protein n=1 Tax=Acrocarpospora sp. B8E8 TaxID=3153572 RepID=UPI00325DE6ED
MDESVWGVEVNETAVMIGGGSDANRWLIWRARFEPVGRLVVLKVGPFGDAVFVACASRENAAELVASWHEGGMVHKSAAKVRQLKPAQVSADDWATVSGCRERLRAWVGEEATAHA